MAILIGVWLAGTLSFYEDNGLVAADHHISEINSPHYHVSWQSGKEMTGIILFQNSISR